MHRNIPVNLQLLQGMNFSWNDMIGEKWTNLHTYYWKKTVNATYKIPKWDKFGRC